MELATESGTLPGRAPKALPADAWGDFLQRLLVTVSDPQGTPRPLAAAASPRRTRPPERGSDTPAGS